MAGAHESVKNSVELVEFCLLPKVETIGTWASDQDDGAVEESVLVLVLWKDLAGGTWGIPCGKNESQWRQCHALGNVELGNLGVLPVVCVCYDMHYLTNCSGIPWWLWPLPSGLCSPPPIYLGMGAGQSSGAQVVAWDLPVTRRSDNPRPLHTTCWNVLVHGTENSPPKLHDQCMNVHGLLLNPDWLFCHSQGWKGECSPVWQRWPVKLYINTVH